MHLTIEQSQLAKAMSKVIGAVERRNVVPILANVLIVATGASVTFTTTDMDMTVTTSVDAEVQEWGATTVSAGMLSSIVSKMAKGKIISFECDGNLSTLTNGKAVFKLSCLPADDFPQFSSTDYTTRFECPSATLRKLLDNTSWAQSTEEVRYYLNGIYLHSVEGKLTAVATDGHKLARVYSDVEVYLDGIIIPRKAVTEVASHLDDDLCYINASETKVQFVCGDTVITTKVIDGKFPDYTRVIPQSSETLVTGDAKELKAASELVSLVSHERTRAVKLTFTAGQCELSVNGQNGDNGKETVSTDYEGEEKTVGFNSKYLAEALAKCGDSDVTLGFGNNMPVVITSGDDPDSLYIVMPMRVS